MRTFTTVGSNNKAFGLSAPNIAEIQVFLSPYGGTRKELTPVYARKTKIKLEEIIGGLNFLIFLSFIVMPVVYWVFDRGLEKSASTGEKRLS